MDLVQQVAAFCAPWKDVYADSTAVSTAVTATHILALLLSGGLAIAADRMTLRALRAAPDTRLRALQELHEVHRPVLMALSVLVLSGILLAAADVETFAASPLFWVKLVLVGLLLGNGALLYRTGSRLLAAPAADVHAHPRWRTLRLATGASLTLWVLTTVVGTVLTSAA